MSHQQLSLLAGMPNTAPESISQADNGQHAPIPTQNTPLYLQGLNEQQQEAVMTPANQALQVLAGAGTGKTELISRRFIKLVKDFQLAGIARPETRILVVTFTSDAALGMRERIHRRLQENGEEGLGPDAWISTFHQFCMRLLRAHPLAVGLPPDFVMLNSLQQQVLFNRVVHGVLAGDYSDIQAILRKFNLADRLDSAILSLPSLKKAGVEDIEALFEPSRLYKLINRIKTAGLSPREFLDTSTAQAKRLTERLKSLPVPHDKELKSIDNILLKLEAWQQALSPWAHSSWNPLQEADRKAEASGKKLTAGSYKDTVADLASFYLVSRTFEPATPDFEALDDVLTLEERVAGLIAAIYALYQETLLAQGACDFDDLINHSIQLLSSQPTLRTRYQQKFEAIIVDEFQDSNGSQLRLLELLMRNQAQNMTVVGDEKQSIYAFRFAQPENLDLIFRHGPYKKVNLQINYRSRPPILAVANHLTQQISRRPNQQLEACEKNAQHAEPTVAWVNLDARIETDNGKLTDPPVFLQKELEARYMAVEIAQLVKAGLYRFSDIAILVKSHAKAEAIQRELAAFNIPSVRQKNLGFFQEPAIKHAMALLRLMCHLGDEMAWVRILQTKLNHKQLKALMDLKHALRQVAQAKLAAENTSAHHTFTLFDACLHLHSQPEAAPELPETVASAVGDLAARMLALRKQKSRFTPVQLFLALAKTVGLIDPELPAWQKKQQRIALRTLEKMLHLFSQGQPLQPTLEEVVETLEQYAADPSQELPVSEELFGEDAVRIMTVFASKGLEFPVVFAAYTEKKRAPGMGDDTALLFDPQYDGKAGFGLMLGKVNGLGNLKCKVYQKCWQGPRGQMEAQRVFYVALTRAMERLYVVRCNQSHDWTAPDGYPREFVSVLSESRDEAYLNERIWQADFTALRQHMAALQEQPV